MGSVVDLSHPTSLIPDLCVIDSNLIIAHFLAHLHRPSFTTASRAARLFSALNAIHGVGIVTTTVWNEVTHAAIKAKYRVEIASHVGLLQSAFPTHRRFDWIDLYKINPTILRQFASELQSLRSDRLAADLIFLQPRDLFGTGGSRTRDEALIDVIGRYGLDSSDASMILEAQQVGVFSVASLDPDILRVAADFDVYTWL